MSQANLWYKCTLALAIALISLASCERTGEKSSSISKAPSAGFKVAILLPNSTNDGGWSQAGYEGLALISKELGAEIAFTANVTVTDAERLFQVYADREYDFIIGEGAQYILAAEHVAEQYPRIKFAVVASYSGNNKNLGALSFNDAELLYLAGAVAALKTKKHRVGFIGGVPYEHLKDQAIAYERGAKAGDPSVKVFIDWVGSWSNSQEAKRIAGLQIKNGADVLLVALDDDQKTVFQEAEKAGIRTIAGASDKRNLSPVTILTSTVQRIPVLLLEGAHLVRMGHWEGKQYKFGIQEGAQDLAPFYGALTREEEKKIERVKQDIVAGKIDVLP